MVALCRYVVGRDVQGDTFNVMPVLQSPKYEINCYRISALSGFNHLFVLGILLINYLLATQNSVQVIKQFLTKRLFAHTYILCY